MAKGQELTDDQRVVFVGGAEFGGARREGTVHRFAQAAVIGVLHHRKVARKLQRNAPARFTRGLSKLREKRLVIFGEAGEAGFVVNVERPGVRCIQEVFTEFLTECRRLFADRFEFGLFVRREFRTRQAEITDFVTDDALLFDVK